MKSIFHYFLILSALLGATAFADEAGTQTTAQSSSPSFTLCKGTYALCTTAKCQPIPGQKGQLSCKCSVQNGYSAGAKDCEPVQHTQAGDVIKSRYFPPKAIAICTNNRPWAWCLDVPCLINKEDPSKSTCKCTVAKDQGPYVIVGDAYNEGMCTTGIISSATVKANDEVNAFINSQKVMPPYTVKVLNKPAN